MTRLKAIIFDMDGTLADTEDIHRQSFNDAFAEFGLPFRWEPSEYKHLLAVSGGRERLRLYLQEHTDDSVFTGPTSELALRLHRRKSEIYRQKLVEGHVGLRPGVGRLIDEARSRDITLAIATSSSTRNAETLIKEALGGNALDLFAAIVTCDIIDEKKPSPAVYLHTLDRLRLDAGDCVALEDTRNGNLAALAAGLLTVITTHRFTIDNDFSGSSLVVDQLGEPDRPAVRLGGDMHGYDYVDIRLLETLLARRVTPATNRATPDSPQNE